MTKLAVHYDQTIDDMHDKVSEWQYEYLTATYMLLLNKKHKKRPIRLMPKPAALAERQSRMIDDGDLAALERMPDSPFADFTPRNRNSGWLRNTL